MPYSVIVHGNVLDWKFTRINGLENCYNFHVGSEVVEIFVGQIFKMGRGRWSAVSSVYCDVCPLDGFRSRHDAAEFLIKWGKLNNLFA